MTYFVGIDTSTTATKALLMDAGGQVVVVASSEYGYDTPQPLWTEQHPDLWWQATVASVRQVFAQAAVDPAEVKCDEIRALLGKERFIQITGNDALTGFTAPKILWVKNHEPEVFARIQQILLPEDYAL